MMHQWTLLNGTTIINSQVHDQVKVSPTATCSYAPHVEQRFIDYLHGYFSAMPHAGLQTVVAFEMCQMTHADPDMIILLTIKLLMP